MKRKKKKNCKTKCPKKCFPCKHWNPPCCLPLLYLKKHVVQLSTSVENHAVFSHWIKFYQCLLYHRNRKSCFYLHKLYTMRVANYILSSPRVLLCNPRLWFLTRITVQKPWKWSWQCHCHVNDMTVFYLFCFFFIWCHFVYLECFWKKKKKSTKKTRVNANMQLCLFIPIGMIKCWFGMVHKQFCWHAYKKLRRGWHLRTDWITFAYLLWNPMMSKASWRTTSQMSASLLRPILKWLLFTGLQLPCWNIHS